jgi:hypothetical protein
MWEKGKHALAHFPEIEFLPIDIGGVGTFFILHVVAAVMAPQRCSLRRSPVSKNIVELYGFPPSYTPSADLFRVAQPDDSAAGRAGFCVRTIYASQGAHNQSSPLVAATWERSTLVDDCDPH